MEQKEEYIYMLRPFNCVSGTERLIIEWANGLKVLCTSSTGMVETDQEPEEEGYIGEYSGVIRVIQVLQPGRDDSVNPFWYNEFIELSKVNMAKSIRLEDGTVLWEKKREA